MFMPLEQRSEETTSLKFTVVSRDTCRAAGTSYLVVELLRLASLMAASAIGFTLQVDKEVTSLRI
jgi:hypothetical protein